MLAQKTMSVFCFVLIWYLFSHFQGQCFIAIDPDAFAPGFSDRMTELMAICRGLEPVSML